MIDPFAADQDRAGDVAAWSHDHDRLRTAISKDTVGLMTLDQLQIDTSRLRLRLPRNKDLAPWAELGARDLGPGQLPAPYLDSRIDIWGQSREEWRARR